MSAQMKNVVIIGAMSGAHVARALEATLPASHRIVLIDANNFAYWPIGALRASVMPGFESNVAAPLDNFFPKGSRHIVLAGYKVTEILERSVKLDKAAPAPFSSSEIDLDVGVIATGTTYALPARPNVSSTEQAMVALKQMQQDVSKAKSILIVGGGPVGVEFAGEVISRYPEKSIALAQRSDKLIQGNFKPSLQAKLLSQLERHKIDVNLSTEIEIPSDLPTGVLLDTPVTLYSKDGRKKFETDFCLAATGGRPRLEAVPNQLLSKSKMSGHSRIAVHPSTLRVEDPIFGKRYLALGDCSNAPGNKTYYAASQQALVVADQVNLLVSGSKGGKKLYKDPGNTIFVPIGPKGGASQLFVLVFGEWVTSMIKGKTLFVDQFHKTFTAPH